MIYTSLSSSLSLSIYIYIYMYISRKAQVAKSGGGRRTDGRGARERRQQ